MAAILKKIVLSTAFDGYWTINHQKCPIFLDDGPQFSHQSFNSYVSYNYQHNCGRFLDFVDLYLNEEKLQRFLSSWTLS